MFSVDLYKRADLLLLWVKQWFWSRDVLLSLSIPLLDWILLWRQNVNLIYLLLFVFQPCTALSIPQKVRPAKNSVDALDLKVSPLSPGPPLFLSSIHPCFHSSVLSHELSTGAGRLCLLLRSFFPPVPGFSWICSSLHNSAVSGLIRKTV